MRTLNLTTCRQAAEKAIAKPMYVYEAVVCGFRIHICWRIDCGSNMFEASISCTRRYAGLHYAYANDIDGILENITRLVEDALRIYTNGGDYAENYTYRVSSTAEGVQEFDNWSAASRCYNHQLCLGLNPTMDEIPGNRNM